jgi:stage III sporulation protein AH
MIIDLKRVGVVLLAAAILALVGSIFVKAVSPVANWDELTAAPVSQPQVAGPTDHSPPESGDKFFAEYRMDRERLRGKQVEMLREILNKSSSDKEARQAASLRLVEISTDMEREMKAENLIKSKGYQDCVVIIQPESTTVVVAAEHLQLDQEQEIIALVSKVTKAREDQVVIIARDAQKSQ